VLRARAEQWRGSEKLVLRGEAKHLDGDCSGEQIPTAELVVEERPDLRATDGVLH
jgi:hypothetical protein